MKKRIYFLVSASIQIVAYIFTIMASKQIVANFLEVAKIYPSGMMDKAIQLYQNSGTALIAITSAICIFLNFLIIFYALNDKLLKKKGAVITCSIISFIFAEYVIIKLLAVINIIVMIILKREKPEDFPDKKEIPKLKKEVVDKKKIGGAILLLGVYFSQFIWSKLIPENSIAGGFIAIGFYILMIVLVIIIFNDLFKNNFKAYINNFSAYMRFIWPRIGIFYLIYLAVSTLIMIVTGSAGSANQASLETLPLFILIPLALFYAPLVEETLFRGCLRRFIKNDTVFIVISGIVFGLIHTITQEATIADAIILAIPYGTLGAFMAYLYTKTNNIFTNMTFHAFQNALAVIVIILMKGL